MLLPALDPLKELGALRCGSPWSQLEARAPVPGRAAQAEPGCRALFAGMQTLCQGQSLQSQSSPDTPHVTGTAFSCALVQDYRELHFIPSLELHTILDFFDMEEELFAVTNFIVNETKLKSNTPQGY